MKYPSVTCLENSQNAWQDDDKKMFTFKYICSIWKYLWNISWGNIEMGVSTYVKIIQEDRG